MKKTRVAITCRPVAGVVMDATAALLLRRGPYETKKTWAPRLVVLTGPTRHGDI